MSNGAEGFPPRPATSPAPVSAPEPGPSEDIETVRELILGPDPLRQRMRRAEVDRLREILVGPQIEDYERRLSDLRRTSDTTLADLRQSQDRVNDLEKSLLRQLEQLSQENRRLNDELRREQERARQRDALLQQLATSLRQLEATNAATGEHQTELRRAFDQQNAEVRTLKAGVNDVRDQQERKTQAVRTEIRQSEEVLRAEMRRLTDRLHDQKTDRKALASMLLEVATRLETGNTVTGLLEGLNASKE